MRKTGEDSLRIIWLGHSGFRIEIERAVLLIDPWLDGNPMFPPDRRAEALAGVTHVLLTHGHGDHSGSAAAICKETGAPLVGIYDLVTWWAAKEGITGLGLNKGGTVDLGGARVTLVNASHSSSVGGPDGAPLAAGSEAGFMIAGEGEVIYLSGDTDLMADMEWMADYHQPGIGILSAGGHYTMDMARAACACRRWFRFHSVIPCHYRTFPALAQDATALIAGVPPGTQVLEPEVLVPLPL
jgi:L-ascorbate metabolism protein UlaG (beta-lactamase superfamily)